ncbi:MAG TPA: site-2 protease family protein [Patescibacteria group bacterium]|nr:site-2 protease family protein [Patescibacteria group bacterium]
MLLTALVFFLILSVLILIHEAGHYFVAKKFGMKVEEFGFGLPPRIWGWKKGETIYSLNWLPIGGFVKLYGEDEAGAGRVSVTKNKELKTKNKKEDESRAFYNRPIGQRFAVVVAGVVMNTLLAVFIYYAFLFLGNFKTELPLLGQHQFFLVNQQAKTDVVISAVAENSPAEQAGLTPFSRMLSVNGEKVTDVETFSATMKRNQGKEVTLEWQSLETQKITRAEVTPRVNPPKNEGSLGVGLFPLSTVTLSYDTPVQKVISGFVHPANLMVYNFAIMGDLINVSVKEKTVEPLSQGVSGPVGIFSLVGTIVDIPDAKERVMQLLNLAGLLSISLAFFNVLPIPGLDGGRLFFIGIEAITRKKVNQKIEGYAHAVGMLLLIGLILLVTLKDINQFFR